MNDSLKMESNEPLLPVSPEEVQRVLRELQTDEQTMVRAVEALQEWASQQQHLPRVSDPRLLRGLWLRRKCSLERTKEAVERYYAARSLVPEVFSSRDPTSPALQTAAKYLHYVAMPHLTPSLTAVIVFRYTGAPGWEFDPMLMFKLVFMVSEVRLRECFAQGEEIVMDMSNFTLGHITRVSPSMMKKVELCGMKAFSARMRSLHFVHAPSFVDTLLTLVKSAFAPKLASRIHVHSRGYEKLHEHIPPRFLPQECGGEAGPIAHISDMWYQKLVSWRDWYKEQESIKVDESKRVGNPPYSSDMFGLEGSFRKLDLD
ncbi:alpha-tocopherol transfer protein-like [Bacillus rossius redtenbacheri]|uniref:alpha-tocopherol transfer protein-like n=1 Tax=Bacillus rossius redtenbacheri TaxID=93214 RepID=UPI002FDEB956